MEKGKLGKLLEVKGIKPLVMAILVVAIVAVVGFGYWIYQRGINDVVHTTTVSFMEQIADHDRLNMMNQMDNKWGVLDTVAQRVEASREYTLEELLYDLGLEVSSTFFEQMFIVTQNGTVYSHTSIKTNLNQMSWHEDYVNAHDVFVTTFSDNSREHWGEYLAFGMRLSENVVCDGEVIQGLVGYVPISEVSQQMRLESFDNLGLAVVIESGGEIITSSSYYETDESNNYLRYLAGAEFQDGYSLDQVKDAIENQEKQYIQFDVDGEGYYALIQPLGGHYDTGWFLVLEISDMVTLEQVHDLLGQSIIFFVVIGLIILAIVSFIYAQMNEVRVLRVVEQTKTNFLANMSHEIRTPLNGISGLCYLMRKNMDDKEKLEEYIDKTMSSTAFLRDIINDVLDMSKIEGGQMDIDKSPLNLVGLLKEVEQLLVTQASDKDQDFTVECSGLKYPWVLGDEVRIKQILMNLLGNGVKFTPNGGRVSLTVKQYIDHATADTTFIIKDNGCGMSREFLDRIWLPFEQEKRVNSQNGTGLGTTITKTLVEKMGGTVDVESQPGKGTTFKVFLPMPIVDLVPELELSSEKDDLTSMKGLKILVAEDNDLNRMIITGILEEKGCIITEAVNGQEAVDLFIASPVHTYDLILMDVQMPIMDGYEATVAIRESYHPDGKTIKIFAVTANAFKEDIERALANGMDAVLTKPLDVDKLFEEIKAIKSKGEEQ